MSQIHNRMLMELFLALCRLFVDLKRLSHPGLRQHLQLDSPTKPELSIQTFPYESVYTELQAVCAALGPKDKVWICDKASCALTQVISKVRERSRQIVHCLWFSQQQMNSTLHMSSSVAFFSSWPSHLKQF